MSEETKNSITIAGAMTAVIMILLIVFGNTGSGFFRNLMVFIVGTIVGTPLSIIGRFIGKWFAKIFMEEYEAIYTYLGFIVGAILGGALAVILFSNKLETSYISTCTSQGLSKSQCECIYNKLDNKYDNLEFILTRDPGKEARTDMLNFTNECIRNK